MKTTTSLFTRLQPTVRRRWLPAVRFRTKPYQELTESLDAALAELEEKYARPNPSPLFDRRLPRG
jgi:hypothetical protein